MKLSKKQSQVYNTFLKENPRILVLSGAKRAGKTFIMNVIFLHHIARFKDEGLSFILGGTTHSSLRRNVLDDLEAILGKELNADKTNAVEIFGNKVYLFDGDKANSYKKVRGFTAAGAFLNEATTLHDTFIKEVISRCSYPGARVFMDTNTENPMHKVKIDYIDKAWKRLDNDQLNIAHYNFNLFDNTSLDPEYVQGIIESTPSGVFTDRDIFGKWVGADGLVYKDFDINKHIRELEDRRQIEKYIVGVDWGYEHLGSIILLGITGDGTYYLIDEIVAQHQEIDYWVREAKNIKDKYGNLTFYCDSARPEHVNRFKREGIRAINADKAVISGIEEVAKLFKQDRLFISPGAEETKKELGLYCWGTNGEPRKLDDDCMDALRYAIYSYSQGLEEVKTISKRRLYL